MHKISLNRKSLRISIAALLASLYIILVWILPFISFMALQLRIANMLIALVPLLEIWGAAIWAIAVLIANLMSPLGFLDLLSAIPSFIGAYIVIRLEKFWKLKGYILGTTIYSIILGLWISFLLNITIKTPFLQLTPILILCIWLPTCLFSTPLYKILIIILHELMQGKINEQNYNSCSKWRNR